MSKQILGTLIISLMVCGTLIGESHGQRQASPHEDPSLHEVSLLLQLRNSDGQLVTYIEPSTLYIRNINMVHEFLDTKENKKIIEKDGEKLESIQYKAFYDRGIEQIKSIKSNKFNILFQFWNESCYKNFSA